MGCCGVCLQVEVSFIHDLVVHLVVLYCRQKLCTCDYQIVVNYIKLTVKAFSDDLWNHNELEVAYLRMGQTFWIASLYKFINCALHTEQFLLILSDLDLGSQ